MIYTIGYHKGSDAGTAHQHKAFNWSPHTELYEYFW